MQGVDEANSTSVAQPPDPAPISNARADGAPRHGLPRLPLDQWWAALPRPARAALHWLWTHRVPALGLPALALALLGEWLLRFTPEHAAPNPALGVRLLQIAALLVGLVAWVHDRPPFRRDPAPRLGRLPAGRPGAAPGRAGRAGDHAPRPPGPPAGPPPATGARPAQS